LESTHIKQDQLSDDIAKRVEERKKLRDVINELKGENLKKSDKEALYKILKKKNHMEIELEKYHMNTVFYKVFTLIIVRG